MNQNRRGFVVIFTVFAASALFGWIYGPSVRATSTAAEDNQSSVRRIHRRFWTWCRRTTPRPVDVDKAVYQGAIPGHAARARSALQFL